MATVERAPDTELILRLRARDRSAWEQLYGEYQPRLRAFAYRLSGNVHDADDLVQETFVRAVPRLDRLDPENVDLGAYLFTTCKNLFYKQVERTKRAEPMAEVPEPVAPAHVEDDPEGSTMLRSQQRDVRLANAKLDSRQRLVLALRELEDRSYSEIGEIVGLKENAVAQLIFRARESLRVEVRLAQIDPDRFPATCQRYLPLLAKHLDGELSGRRLDETLAHLEGCERCQSALADMREASRRYRALFLPPFLDGDDCKAAIDLRLDDVGYWASAAGGRRFTGWRRGVAVAVGLLALGAAGTAAGVILAQDDGTKTVAPTALTTSPAPASPPPPAPETTVLPPRSPVATPPPATEEAAVIETVSTVTETTVAESVTETLPASTETAPAPKPKPKPKPVAPTPTPVPPPSATPVDTTAPKVTVTSAPSGTVEGDKAEIVFLADDATARFNCSADGSAAEPCSSPVTLTGLAAGAHRFSILATDLAGNSSAWTVVSWTITPPDTTAPTTRFTSSPPRSTSDPNPRFEFVADESPVSFECALDKEAFASCSSPAGHSKLAYGAHSFSVRATDKAGNVGQPATVAWTIVRALPDLVITAFSANSIQITNQGTASAPANVLSITLVGTFTVPALAPGASVRLTWSTCRAGTYTAIVDRGQVVAELDEANNAASRRNTCTVIG